MSCKRCWIEIVLSGQKYQKNILIFSIRFMAVGIKLNSLSLFTANEKDKLF